MAVYLDAVSLPQATDDTKFHLMPCQIEHNGDVKVEQYFETSVRGNVDKETKKTELTACFRGRPLNGEIQKVPSGYTDIHVGQIGVHHFMSNTSWRYATGIVMKETRRPFSEEEDRNFTISHKFDNFHYWNLDKKPSSDDRLHQALDWIEIAKVLHRPLDADDSQKSVVGQ